MLNARGFAGFGDLTFGVMGGKSGKKRQRSGKVSGKAATSPLPARVAADFATSQEKGVVEWDPCRKGRRRMRANMRLVRCGGEWYCHRTIIPFSGVSAQRRTWCRLGREGVDSARGNVAADYSLSHVVRA